MKKKAKKGSVAGRIFQRKIAGAAVACAAGLIVCAAVGEVCSAAGEAYHQALEEQSRETYESFYESAFSAAEKKYHVSNEVKITIENIREESELEVLQVSDIEYVFHEDNNKIWTAVRGHGIYTVDLEISEFVIDSERQYVLARIPKPRLNTAGLDYEYENYLFKDGIFNGNTSEGVALARQDLKTAQNQLQEKLLATQAYYEMAENSAQELVEKMIRNFNPGLPGLTVEVEFMD